MRRILSATLAAIMLFSMLSLISCSSGVLYGETGGINWEADQ